MSPTATFGLEHARNPIDRAELHRVLDELLDAREQSEPNVAAKPGEICFREVKGKDAVARAVAAAASHLMLQAAGWATNHNIGRALAEKSHQTTDANSHQLESDGQEFALQCYGGHSPEDAELGRTALMAAVDCTFYPVPVGLVWEMRNALAALDFGETQALFAPSKRGLHGDAFTLAHLRLNALEHVYFLIGRDRRKGEAWERVADAKRRGLDCSPSTEKTQRSKIGCLLRGARPIQASRREVPGLASSTTFREMRAGKSLRG